MRILKWGLLALALLLVVPVLIAQLGDRDARTFEAVSLDETSYSEVHFDNRKEGLRLEGMLFLPEGAGPFPAAVVIHGSGSSRRTNRWYLSVVDYLQRAGVAVLLPDKRGSERSGGEWQTASYEALATDTIAAVEFVQSFGANRISRVGLIGMSQGGRIAPIVAASLPELSFVVNVVGGALPAHQALVFEEMHNLRGFGVLPGLADLLAYPAAWSLIHLRMRDHWTAVGNFDPLPYWEQIATPTLVLYGAEDTNTNSTASAARLQSLGKANIEIRVFSGSGHALEDPPGGDDRLVREDALKAMHDFIRASE